MQAAHNKRGSSFGLYLFGLATGLLIALICFAVHEVKSMWSNPPPLVASDIKELNSIVWQSKLSSRMIPIVDLPASAKDIVIYDRSGIDDNVFMSFRTNPQDLDTYINAYLDLRRQWAGPDDLQWKKRNGQTSDDSNPHIPSPPPPTELPPELQRYWLPYQQTDYYFNEPGFYIGIDGKNNRVFIHQWTM